MIIYSELSTVEKDLGIPLKTLYGISNNLEKHYHYAYIPKRDGTMRKLTVPDEALKNIQRRIADKILAYETISVYAKAYRHGASVQSNARPHIGKEKILKLDILHFFDSIFYSSLKEKVFPSDRFSEPCRVLLSILCYYKDTLPQGAPSSPAITNIIMREFDDTVGEWCREKNITYTRYSDDMTFSGSFNEREVTAFVRQELRNRGFLLNEKKLTVVTSSKRQTVTGIVVNEKLNVSSDYKRKIRQEVFYCRKYGISEHLERTGVTASAAEYLRSLLGKITFVLQTDKNNKAMQEAKLYVTDQLKKLC